MADSEKNYNESESQSWTSTILLRDPTTRTYCTYRVYTTDKSLILIASEETGCVFSVLKITAFNGELSVQPLDQCVSEEAANNRLNSLEPTEGTATLVDIPCHGIQGFIQLTKGFYIILITKKRKVGDLFCTHPIYAIEETKTLSLAPRKSSTLFLDANSDDPKYLDLLEGLNTGANCYFSYGYDLTTPFQFNYINEIKSEIGVSLEDSLCSAYDDHPFFWNFNLVKPLIAKRRVLSRWILPTIQGYFGSAVCNATGRLFWLTIIGRRSRFFAGTRYRKRGVNNAGYAANEVETEQIVFDWSLSRAVLSFVQVRGSVPLYWSQDPTPIMAKPPIIHNNTDLTHSATKKHFGNLMARYGAPVVVVTLIALTDKLNKERQLGTRYFQAVQAINKDLPAYLHINYKSIDLRQKHKSKGSAVSKLLLDLSKRATRKTGYFFVPWWGGKNKGLVSPIRIQCGVVRTNCIDCLDRTNASQFYVGAYTLAEHLCILSYMSEVEVDLTCDVMVILARLYNNMGDQLSLQYGGSVAHRTYTSDESQFIHQSRELLTSLARHYASSFVAAEIQHSTNLILGLLKPFKHPTPWTCDSDAWLHTQIDEEEKKTTDLSDFWLPRLGSWLGKNYWLFTLADTHNTHSLHIRFPTLSSFANYSSEPFNAWSSLFFSATRDMAIPGHGFIPLLISRVLEWLLVPCFKNEIQQKHKGFKNVILISTRICPNIKILTARVSQFLHHLLSTGEPNFLVEFDEILNDYEELMSDDKKRFILGHSPSLRLSNNFPFTIRVGITRLRPLFFLIAKRLTKGSLLENQQYIGKAGLTQTKKSSFFSEPPGRRLLFVIVRSLNVVLRNDQRFTCENSKQAVNANKQFSEQPDAIVFSLVNVLSFPKLTCLLATELRNLVDFCEKKLYNSPYLYIKKDAQELRQERVAGFWIASSLDSSRDPRRLSNETTNEINNYLKKDNFITVINSLFSKLSTQNTHKHMTFRLASYTGMKNTEDDSFGLAHR